MRYILNLNTKDQTVLYAFNNQNSSISLLTYLCLRFEYKCGVLIAFSILLPYTIEFDYHVQLIKILKEIFILSQGSN